MRYCNSWDDKMWDLIISQSSCISCHPITTQSGPPSLGGREKFSIVMTKIISFSKSHRISICRISLSPPREGGLIRLFHLISYPTCWHLIISSHLISHTWFICLEVWITCYCRQNEKKEKERVTNRLRGNVNEGCLLHKTKKRWGVL